MTKCPKAAPVVGLEIGTSKICVAVGEQAEGKFNILGIGQSRSRGVRKGEICTPQTVAQDVRAALSEAEHMADVKIRRVFLGVTGSHVCGFNQHAEMGFSAGHAISQEDMEQLVCRIPAVNLPAGNQIIQVIPQPFIVDGKQGVINPRGMMGSRIQANRHVVCGQPNRLQNAIDALYALSLAVDGLVFNGLASSQTLLTQSDKESGALVIDIGGGATEFVVYAKGMIQLSGVLAVGGDHVSNDLAYGLKIPLSRAEKLKIEIGSSWVTEGAKPQQFPITGDHGCVTATINVGYLQQIMSLRLAEILRFIARQLEQAGFSNDLRAGIFLCGGVARTPGITRLAEAIFRTKAALGRINAVDNLSPAMDQPEFATAIGLAQYGLAATPEVFERIPPPSPSNLGTTAPKRAGSAGRFSNTEPTRCDGEDLDVPTFVRRDGQEPTTI